jgi:hypothetical protein
MGCIHKTKQRCAKQGFDEREESEPSQLGTSTESRPAMSYPSILFQAITVTGGQKVFVRFSLGDAASRGSLIKAKKRRCLARMGGNLIKAESENGDINFLRCRLKLESAMPLGPKS